jgi:outer membrane receptor protein involved in Fe transport
MERCFIAGLFATIVASLAQATPTEPATFDIDAPNLADALDRFSEQTGLQVVYDENVIAAGHAVQMQGSMPIERALERMLAGSGLVWTFVSDKVVLVRRRVEAQQKSQSMSQARRASPRAEGVTTLSLVKVTEDSTRSLAQEPTESAFGFSKPLIATPRSVSLITDDLIEAFGLSAVEDLTVLAPGVFTTTRYGIQGSVDVRNVPADTYFRGMKRLTLQGHGRSVFAAMDTIEVVRGPPSPIDGLGKVGGFTNVVPKSGRARAGGYVQALQGFTQLTYGTDERREASFGLGGPIHALGKQGGYYTFALLEDSNSYTERVPVRQQALQAALSIEEFTGPLRLEMGWDYQVSTTSGALLNRVTQDLIDNGRYIRGEPLALLDTDGSGAIGYLEYSRGSPVRGQLSPGNQPLVQRWAWPRDAQGNLRSLDQRQAIAGIPQSLYDYLVASCGPTPPQGSNGCADPTGALRAQGIGGPQPVSGYVPIGFALDPRTVGYTMLDPRRAAAYERELEAKFVVFFADLIYDADPNFTLKNQLFVDNMDQFKLSEQPSGGKQDVLVVADKLTATYRWIGAPAWLRINGLGSIIARETHSTGKRYSGDFGSHRTDAMANDGLMTPNTTFVHPFDNSVLDAGGALWMSHYATRYSELGAGLMVDVDLFDRTNVIVGGRIDGSEARNTDYAGTLDPNVGTVMNPGAVRARNDTAKAWDTGASWSVSLSREIAPGFRPYATYSRASVMLDNNNNSMDNAVIRTGHIGAAEMRELGIKGSLFDERVYFTTALYDQWRSDGSPLDPSAQLSTDLTLTRTRGWETEIKWLPAENLYVSLHALAQKTDFRFSAGGNILVDARALGFQDVLDANGNVIYPAEAFLYGGRAFLTLPAGIEAYEEKQGNPNVQLGLNATYELARGLGITLASTYVSSVSSGRLKLVELPASVVFDAGVFFERRGWRVKLDVGNLFNERYFRARTGDTLGDTHVQAMPRRHCQMALRYSF